MLSKSASQLLQSPAWKKKAPLKRVGLSTTPRIPRLLCAPQAVAAATESLAVRASQRSLTSKSDAHHQQAQMVKVLPPPPTRPICEGAHLQATESVAAVPRAKPKVVAYDGNTCAAHVAFGLSDISFIYPISPATSMGERMDEWTAAGKKNIFGQSVSVNMMQSEAGAAGALHGAAAAGALTSTFTASQGLLLMIPNMYLLAGELTPTVFHVAARTVSKHALSIFNDHSDVMACRQTGFAMLCSSSVQEVMDLALVSHLSAIKSRLPFMHFFDGNRTSAEIQKIEPISFEQMASVYPREALRQHLHKFALNPNHPSVRGTGQRPDIFFQNAVAAEKYYKAAPQIVLDSMRDVEALTGRRYNLFDYYGSPTADRVVVMMGSGSKTVEEAVSFLNETLGQSVGVLNVRLYRPWSAEHFLKALPPTARKIAVLDKTREDGASGCPLFLDVCVTLSDRNDMRLVTNGQYGLASKEFTPEMAKAVFDNLNEPEPRQRYVIGVDDDVTHTSLPYQREPLFASEGTSQCLLYGLGGDGMVGASKNLITVIGSNTDMYVQGHTVYDSKKSEGLTVGHLRFGTEPIKSAYGIQNRAKFIECSHPSYVNKYDMISPLEHGGTFALNTPYTTLAQLEEKLPPFFKHMLASKDANFYVVDAVKVATDMGLGARRINSVMSAAFYKLSGVLPEEQAVELLKNAIAKQYKHKGPEVVEMNKKAVDATFANLVRVDYPKEAWLRAMDNVAADDHSAMPAFVRDIMNPVLAMKGDKLPVSAFEPGGYQPIGTTAYEKRGVAPEIPIWIADKCTQCNYCAIVCPHAVIRPFLLDRQESRATPDGYEYRKAKGGQEVAGFNYTIQVSPMDCTGCAICVESCPDDALFMSPFTESADKGKPHWDYSVGLRDKGQIGDKFSVKGSQFQQPLMEFSGACSGCGETPYVKLATQMFGDRMVIANASGCSSVWGGSSTTIPYTTNSAGKGPAWGRSLFEDNAEYGLGMMLGTKQRRDQLANDVRHELDTDLSPSLRDAFTKWLQYMDDPERCDHYSKQIMAELQQMDPRKIIDPVLRSIHDRMDMLRTQSHWIIGGDGWAYDIGLGGVDHVLSLNENVNVMVLDTEMYSNTGGEQSKATPMSAVVKYATSGKQKAKKDLGMHAMLYENVYVASCALGANMNQTVQAFKEAEQYDGPSLLLCYSPCIDWGIDMRHQMDGQKQAVDSGYWSLYRYDPRRRDQGVNPFQLDSKKVRVDMANFLKGQNRFERLFRDSAEQATRLQTHLKASSMTRHEKFQRWSMDDQEQLEFLMDKLDVHGAEGLDKEKSIVLYGSETGNAQALAGNFAQELKRRGIVAKATAMDDLDFDDLTKYTSVYCVVATAGQGELPANCQEFYKALSSADLADDHLAKVRFCVFGLGDTGYVYFNEAAKKINAGMEKLGAKPIVGVGLGDDKDDERYETKFNEWMPELWNELGTPPPPQVLLPPTYKMQMDTSGSLKLSGEPIVPSGAKLLPLTKNVLLTPPEYDRIIRHYEIDLKGSGYQYGVGDCLGVHPQNNKQKVDKFLYDYGLDPHAAVILEDTLDRKEPLPAVMSVHKLFTEVLDIFGRPMRRFYEMLAIAAQDDAEKAELEFVLTKEGAERYKELVAETVTHADLLLKYKSAKLSLDYLIDHVPAMKPRLYSIASSQEMHPDTIELCIVKDDWTTPSGRYREGLCTEYIEDKSLDGRLDKFACRMNAAGINIPDSQRPPYIMVALGTGIAPMRSMVEDREVARLRGETVGEMALFFGARYKATDYSYGDEFDAYHAGGNGVLSVLSNAFSRDQSHKIYVQHRIAEHPHVIHDYLMKKDGYFYVCGPGGSAMDDVRKAVVEAVATQGGHTTEQANNIINQLQIEGRYNVEAW